MRKTDFGEIKKRLIPTDRVEKTYLYAILVSYIIILIWGIVFKCNVNAELNIQKNLAMSVWERLSQNPIPFQAFYHGIVGRRKYEILAGVFNIICFIPLGAILNFLIDRKRGLIYTALAVLGVEIFQLFSGLGGFDYSDIILNTLGAYLGYVICSAILKRMSIKVVNTIALSLVFPFAVFAIAVFIRTIIYFPI
jgi:glycopeptide antibiotics resistance protein